MQEEEKRLTAANAAIDKQIEDLSIQKASNSDAFEDLREEIGIKIEVNIQKHKQAIKYITELEDLEDTMSNLKDL